MSTSGREGIGDIYSYNSSSTYHYKEYRRLQQRIPLLRPQQRHLHLRTTQEFTSLLCQARAVRKDRDYEYLQHLPWKNLVKNTWWSVPSPHFPTWRHDIVAYRRNDRMPSLLIRSTSLSASTIATHRHHHRHHLH